MATYNELAAAYSAQKQADYEKSLSYLTSDVTKQQTLDDQALKSRYDTLLSQIGRQADTVKDTYSDEVRQAYVNKMLSGQQLGTQLSQLGLNTQGFGVTQQLANENAFGANQSAAMQTRDTGLQKIADTTTDTMSQYNQDQLGLQSDYVGKLSDIQKYISQMGLSVGQQEYANFLGDLQYQDQLKQQAIENSLAGGGSGGLFDDTPIAPLVPVAPVAPTPKAQTQTPAQKLFGTFSNGYQPKGVLFDNGKSTINYGAIEETGKTTTHNGKTQNIWKTKNGMRWIWDGTSKSYIPYV